MITKNFKQVAKQLLCFGSSGGSQLPIKIYSGMTRYLAPSISAQGFPASTHHSTFQTTASGTGIHIGSGNTPATENDYDLEAQITSGVSGTVAQNLSQDSNVNPQRELVVTITNTGNTDITINEIGYFDGLNCNSTQGSTSSFSVATAMLDRTVLAAPLTIAAGDYGVIKYTLKGIEV